MAAQGLNLQQLLQFNCSAQQFVCCAGDVAFSGCSIERGGHAARIGAVYHAFGGQHGVGHGAFGMQHTVREEVLGVARERCRVRRVARNIDAFARILPEIEQDGWQIGEMDVFIVVIADNIERAFIRGEAEALLVAVGCEVAEIEFPENRFAPEIRRFPRYPWRERMAVVLDGGGRAHPVENGWHEID